MMLKTHLALSVFLVLLFIPYVSGKLVFSAVLLIATILPDADTAFSTAGRNIISRITQLCVRHRGFLHSLTFCIGASILIAFFLPVISLPFFLGYGFHIFLDSFTREGIMPFWPWTKTSSGVFRTGGRVESSIFVSFIILDIIMLIFLVSF